MSFPEGFFWSLFLLPLRKTNLEALGVLRVTFGDKHQGAGPPGSAPWYPLTHPGLGGGGSSLPLVAAQAWMHGGGKVGPGFGLRRRARSSGPRFLHLGKGHNPSVSVPQGRREASPGVLRSAPRRAVVIGSLRL